MMRIYIVFFSAFVISCLISCNDKKQTTYYLNLDTGKIYNQNEFIELKVETTKKYLYVKQDVKITYNFEKEIIKGDSIINPYKIDIIKNGKYIVKASNKERIFDFIDQKFPSLSINKENKIDAFNSKPTVLNFWFIKCKPCVEEIESLNLLVKEYQNEVNFIAITFDEKTDVDNFLKNKDFNFQHITNAESLIDSLGILAFPKTVFIDKKGYVKFIENGVTLNESDEYDLTWFKKNLDELIQSNPTTSTEVDKK